MQKITSFEERAFKWMANNGIILLRISIGIVFLWFGLQKFFPGLSSAEDLASRTISVITFGIVSPAVSMPVLALWESLIGLTFITGFFMRWAVPLLFLQMIGTVMPLFLFPTETFVNPPTVPTLIGQYIIKNLVVVTGAMVAGAYHKGFIVIKTKQ